MGAKKIEVTLSETAALRFASKARDLGRTEPELLAAVIDSYLDEDDEFRAGVQEGIAQIEAGKGIPHAEVEALIQSLRESKTARAKRR